MKRRTFLTGLAGTAGAVTIPYVRGARAQTPITLRFAHYAAENHPGHIAALQFAERVKADYVRWGAIAKETGFTAEE